MASQRFRPLRKGWGCHVRCAQPLRIAVGSAGCLDWIGPLDFVVLLACDHLIVHLLVEHDGSWVDAVQVVLRHPVLLTLFLVAQPDR